jgi:signal transduction histidine kinase
MQSSSAELIFLIIVITTLLILLFGGIIVRYVFLYQKKRYRHEQEKLAMQKEFHDILTQSKLEIQEQTLDHISKEMHDHFGPMLWNLKNKLKHVLPAKPDLILIGMEETAAEAQELYDRMRALSLSLNTDQVMRLGFRQSLQNELNRLSKKDNYTTNLTVKASESYIEPERAIILFRICQEALNNIVKHASASRIDIIIDYTKTPAVLTITDNGMGFDPDATNNDLRKQDSTGLLNMLNRARLIHAHVKIESQPGHGTQVIIHFPKLNDSENDILTA